MSLPPFLTRLLHVLAVALLGCGVALAAWIRLPYPTPQSAWAEDAWTFLAGSLDGQSIFTPYEGYLHVVPRLLADLVVATTPVAGYAMGMAVLSCLVVGAIGIGLYLCSAEIILFWPLRIALAFLPAVVPLTAVEVLGNTANLHSLLLFLVPWLLLARLRTWTAGIAAGIAGILIGLTEIQAIVFAPLVLVNWRNRKRLPLVIGLGLALLAQIISTLTSPRTPDEDTPNSLIDIARAFLLQAIGGSWTARIDLVGEFVSHYGIALVLVPFALAILGLLVWGFVAAQQLPRVMIATLAAASVALWFAAVILNPAKQFSISMYTLDDFSRAPVSRYAAVSSLFLYGALLVTAAVLFARRSWVSRAGGILIVGAMAVAIVLNFSPSFTTRIQGPPWADQVRAAAIACATEPYSSERIVAPPNPARWYLDIPCEKLLQ